MEALRRPLENIVSGGRAFFLRANAFRAPKKVLFLVTSVSPSLIFSSCFALFLRGICFKNRLVPKPLQDKAFGTIRITSSCAKTLKKRSAKFANKNADHFWGCLVFEHKATIKIGLSELHVSNATKIGIS